MPTVHLYGVWGSGPTSVFAVGDRGAILRFDGASWAPMSTGKLTMLRDVWGDAPDAVFAVGHSGTILRYDGASWAPARTDLRRDGTLLCPAGFDGVGGVACPQDCPAANLGNPQREFCFVNGVCVGPGCP